MKKLLLASMLAGGLVVPAPMAGADPCGDPTIPPTAPPATCVDYVGGCGFDSSTDPTGEIANPGTYTGAIYAVVAASSTDAEANPVNVSVTCNLYVNSGLVDSETFTDPGVGFVAGAADTSFTAADGDVVQLCTHVIAGGTDFGEICATADHITIPPDEVIQLLDQIFDILIEVAGTIDGVIADVFAILDPVLTPIFALLTQIEVQVVDPLVCPPLDEAGPVGDKANDPIYLDDDGDIYLFGVRFWDCPVYGDPE